MKADRTFINKMKISDNRELTFYQIKDQMNVWADQLDLLFLQMMNCIEKPTGTIYGPTRSEDQVE